jgi:type I restriction enzyme S subunit
MSKMKYSRIEWIGDIPAKWNVNKLKNIANIYTGNSISDDEKSLYEDETDAYPYIATKDIDTLTLRANYKNGMYTKIKDKKFKIASRDDTLLCIEGGSAGKKMTILEQNVSFVNKLCCISSIGMNKKYVYFYLQSDAFKERFNQNIFGLIGGVSQYVLKQFPISVPSINEQQLIANFLDNKIKTIDEIINDLNKEMEILNNYKKQLITEVITTGLDKNVNLKESGIDWMGKIPKHWKIKRLKYLGVARNGLTYDPENQVEDGILVMRSSNIQNGKLSLEDNVYVNMKIPKNIILKKDDLLICSRNGSRNLIGKNLLIDENMIGNTYGAFMCVFRSDYNKFIHYVFNSNIFDYYLNSFLTSTINQLTNSNLYSIKIAIPMDINEQQQIVEYLDKKCSQIDKILEEKSIQIEQMEQYKKSVIYEYVTGKKRVEGAEELYG